MRSSVMYAAGELRRIGRVLVDGSWSAKAKPMTVLQALSVMAEAMGVVADTGVGHVIERAKELVGEYAERMRARPELNFDDVDKPRGRK